jgi:RNA polymerase sigma-70 factor (ECF subfamily)
VNDLVNDYADFDAFLTRTWSRMLARAVLYCGHRQNAEDALQEAYLEAYRHWPELRNPTAWLETTMRRRFSRDARRWWSRWHRHDLELPVPPSSSAEEEFRAVSVLRAIGMLPTKQRTVLVMVCLEGLTYQQVAAELGITTGGVGANLAKARARLTMLLGLAPEPHEPGDPLVASARIAGTRLFPESDDPLTAALRMAERWVARGFESDGGPLERFRDAVRREAGEQERG